MELTSNKSSYNEDESLQIFLDAPTLQNSYVSYTVSGISEADLDTTKGAGLVGVFTTDNYGKASLNFYIKADNLTEGSETFTLSLTDTGRTETISVPISDTSVSTTKSLSSTNTISASSYSINEGTTVTFTITGITNVTNGQSLNYEIISGKKDGSSTGFSVSDITGSLTGTFVVNNGSGSFSVQVNSDLFYDSGELSSRTEYFHVRVYSNPDNEINVLGPNMDGYSTHITIADSSVPAFSLSGPASISEGTPFTITLIVTGSIGQGTLIPYSVSGINDGDLASGTLAGNFTLTETGNPGEYSGTANFILKNDLKTEPFENFVISVNNGATTYTKAITDSSQAPPAEITYSLQASSLSVTEGDTVTITLYTTNVSNGTLVPYTITGVSASDIGTALTGNFTVTNNSSSLTLNITQDGVAESAETIRLSLNGTSEYVEIIIQASVLNPTAPSYSLSSSSSNLKEGNTVVVSLTTTNLGIGVFVPYLITGTNITSGDLNVPLAGGGFTLDSAGAANITIAANSDLLTEGTETLRLSLVNSPSNYVDINIVDISVSLPTYTLTANTLTNKEGNSTIVLLSTTNVPAGSNVAYIISGVTANDISNASLTGILTINATGKANLIINFGKDNILEGTEIAVLSLVGINANVNLTVLDTSRPAETYSLSSSANSISEGSTVSITLSTTGLFAGTEIPYTISGTSLDDFSSISAGTFTTSANGNSTINFTLLKDYITEVTESFILTLTGRNENVTIRINDYNYQASVPNTFVEANIVSTSLVSTVAEASRTKSIPSLSTRNKPSATVKKIIPDYFR